MIIETDEKTIIMIRLYCNSRNMKMKTFVRTLCDRDEDFNNFKENVMKSKVLKCK